MPQKLSKKSPKKVKGIQNSCIIESETVKKGKQRELVRDDGRISTICNVEKGRDNALYIAENFASFGSKKIIFLYCKCEPLML